MSRLQQEAAGHSRGDILPRQHVRGKNLEFLRVSQRSAQTRRRLRGRDDDRRPFGGPSDRHERRF